MQVYQRNEIAADRAYKGVRYTITGTIDSISNDLFGAPYLTLRTDELLGKVQASFPRSDEAALSRLSRLSPGSTVGVSCVISGKMMNVLARECRLD